MPYPVRFRRRLEPELSNDAARRDLSKTRLIDYGTERLRMLCEGAGYGDSTEAVISTFRALLTPWGEAEIGQSSGWVSDISDDNTPIELSVAIADGKPEVRVLLEAQAREPTLKAQREAGLAFNARLERELGASLDRFRQVQDLFLPEDLQGSFAVWNAVVFSPGKAPELKAYFNPQARGREYAQALVEEALLRLGFPRAWATLGLSSTRRSPLLDEVKYFALDLSDDDSARVKVYVHHHRATPEDLELACRLSGGYVRGEARDFARAMRGGGQRLSARSPFTCAAFVSGPEEHAAATTLYIPICAYSRDDAVVRDRVDSYLQSSGIDPAPYDRIVEHYPNRALDEGVGMQSWVALRRRGSTARLTVYLATEAKRVFAPGTIPAATVDRLTFSSAEEIIAVLRGYDLADHPFLRRIKREPDSARLLWLLVANAYEGTSRHFIRWLATVTARVDDDRMRCLLARQLDQELGEGVFARAHSVLMQAFLGAIERLRPKDFRDAHLAPGRRLGERLARHYLSNDPFEGVAALMAGEICAQQLIHAVAGLLRAQRCPFDADTLAWLTLHEELEGNHAEESFALARLVPREKEAIDGIYRGAMGMHTALWSFLDELYRACFAIQLESLAVPAPHASGTRRRAVPASTDSQGASSDEQHAGDLPRPARSSPARPKRAATPR